MKKLVLPIVCSVLAIGLVGCSQNGTTTINNLEAQIERTSVVVSGTNRNEINSVSPSCYEDCSLIENDSLSDYKNESYSNMIREENLRQDVLDMTNHLKSNLNKRYTLGKNKINALKSLTKNLDKYTTSLGESKANVRENVYNIRKFTAKNIDEEQAKSSYTELNNLMGERAIYLHNLRNNLAEIQNLLYSSESKDAVSKNDDIQEKFKQNQAQKNQENSNKNERIKNPIRKNIDTFNSNRNSKEFDGESTTQNEQINNEGRIYNSYMPQYNNQYYNYYNRDFRFNPYRNTDTFYPRARNIDTYRFAPNTNPNGPYPILPENQVMSVSNENTFDEDCENKCEERETANTYKYVKEDQSLKESKPLFEEL